MHSLLLRDVRTLAVLLRAGADPFLLDSSGVSPVEAAKELFEESEVGGRYRTLYSWGTSSNYQLGYATSSIDISQPKWINLASLESSREKQAREGYPPDAVHVSCSKFHTTAVTSDGAVYVWGVGQNGQLGLGGKRATVVPSRVEGFGKPGRRLATQVGR
jgi:inhibitor of Bruton tyrosine kinase